MVRLYKKLREYNINMNIHMHGETVYFTFNKKNHTDINPVHIDLLELNPDEAEDILIKHLGIFLDTIK